MVGKLIVSIADMKVSADPGDFIITYALGSCLGITIYDHNTRVGGMLHAMLPDSSIQKKVNDFNPFKYVNTGIPMLFKEAYKYGAKKSSIEVKMAGCSQLMDDNGVFNIGKRNYAAARKLLWKNHVLVEAEHCQQNDSVTLTLEISTGQLIMKIANKEIPL